jgi:hypothetical protein
MKTRLDWGGLRRKRDKGIDNEGSSCAMLLVIAVLVVREIISGGVDLGPSQVAHGVVLELRVRAAKVQQSDHSSSENKSVGEEVTHEQYGRDVYKRRTSCI